MALAGIEAVDDVVAPAQLVDQHRDLAHRVLEIVVDDGGAVSGDVVQPAHDRVVLAEVSRQPQVLDHGRISPLRGERLLVALVHAAVVDQHDLERPIAGCQGLDQGVDQPADRRLAVVDRDDDAELRDHRGSVLCLAAPRGPRLGHAAHPPPASSWRRWRSVSSRQRAATAAGWDRGAWR